MGRRKRSCVYCGRDVRSLTDARQEGSLSFCSQSCFLAYSSTPSRPANAGHRRGGVFRVVGKTIKWLLITVVLATCALVIAVIVGVGKVVSDAQEGSNPITKAEFVQVKAGMTQTQVKRILGDPGWTEDSDLSGTHVVCWTYGDALSADGWANLCFDQRKLANKSRSAPSG
jgi:hypothetical protein